MRCYSAISGFICDMWPETPAPCIRPMMRLHPQYNIGRAPPVQSLCAQSIPTFEILHFDWCSPYRAELQVEQSAHHGRDIETS